MSEKLENQSYEKPFGGRKNKLHHSLALVYLKAWYNLKSEARKNYLSFFWWLIEPVLHMLVFYLIFGLLLKRGGGGDFVAYLLIGLVPFQWFAKVAQTASGSIKAGKNLMQQINIFPLFFPLVVSVQSTIKQLAVFFILLLLLIIYGIPPSIHWLALPILLILQFFFLIALGGLLAMLVPFWRDITNIVPTGIQFMLFASGIFYPTEIIPERFQTYFFANPMASFLSLYREILMYQQWPDLGKIAWVMFVSFALIACIGLMYRRVAGSYPRMVLE